jgi:hypothetical protein
MLIALQFKSFSFFSFVEIVATTFMKQINKTGSEKKFMKKLRSFLYEASSFNYFPS